MSTRSRPVVAIDGPAGAGKSTVARLLAERLGFTLLDTGALYRTVALAATRASVGTKDQDRVAAVARAIVERNGLAVERSPQGGTRVLLDGEDVSQDIRAPEMGMAASDVSAIPAVRDALLELQRRAGRDGGVVLEGRDIGTVVFPDAEVKFFLTASVEVRARRRFDENVKRGANADFDETLADVRARDKQDTLRPIAPLKAADDAVIVDSSAKSADEVVEAMAQHVRRTMSA